jgi:3-oxoacyl-[acyl-carrier protein] reductase
MRTTQSSRNCLWRRRFARDGLAVAVNDRRGEGEPVAAAIREGGGAAAAFAADVTDAQAVGGLVDAIERKLGPVGVLVLNATGPQPEAPLAAVGWRDHLDQLDCFLKSLVLLGRAVLAGMRERGWGRIVQVDSEVVDRPPPGRSAYAAAKAAQIGGTATRGG